MDKYIEENSPFLQKTFDMMDYAYPALAQFPKSEKYAMAEDIKKCMDTILEKAIEGNKKYYKKNTLQELDVAVAKLKVYVRLAHRQGFLSHKKYEEWSKYIVEMGKMVGGWINSLPQRK
ncbi:MAG: diversity-generating retroelement protein Avd [Clostridiales bacterium]|nr:diversity-generating retroelement protein Avd [Clostridiales bacterium]